MDAFYALFEEHFRGSREEIKGRQRFYLPYAEQAAEQTGSRMVLDIGSGRGEWLELLQHAGFEAIGVEPNRIFREDCNRLGLSVTAGDGILFLQRQRPESLGMVTSFHVAEHLPFERLVHLVQAAYQALRPGGCLILETPNPNCLQVGASSFYTDPTHQRPIVPATLDFVCMTQGFEQRRTIVLHPPDNRLPEEQATNLRPLIDSWNSGRDYAVIGYKPGSTASAVVRYRLEGPFDSSYSLALLNREMARALNRLYPGEVALVSTEGGGDFEPSSTFLAHNPDLQPMWRHSSRDRTALVAGRNLYPPRVTGMQGMLRVMTAYGWEESEFPWEAVQEFNRHLDGVTVMSRFVQKVLVDAGVTVPISVVGVGADHILNITPSPCPEFIGTGFHFLHISSCFPRKGADLLLAAYYRSFTAQDPVTLVIKTFPNPHNQIEQELEQYRRMFPQGPAVVLINADCDDGLLVDLYQRCHCLVAPSRGEGFGLPPAEAMLYNLPVITTGYGGQTDFCTEETAWLIDYDFAPARTHMGLAGSVWAEPRTEHLAELMREIYQLHHEAPEKLTIKTDQAKKLILQQYRWDDCARRFDSAVNALKQKPAAETPIRLGWVHERNPFFSSSILPEHLNSDLLTPVMLANQSAPAAPHSSIQHRYWDTTDDHTLNKLLELILAEQIDFLVVQLSFSFFSLQALAGLFEELLKRHTGIVMLTGTIPERILAELASIAPVLAKIDRIIVPSVVDLNILKEFHIVSNVTLFASVLPERAGEGTPDNPRHGQDQQGQRLSHLLSALKKQR
jgi:glycosyltransferase involved in cell wall biosynthesis/SAM-dependent methyltransferase